MFCSFNDVVVVDTPRNKILPDLADDGPDFDRLG